MFPEYLDSKGGRLCLEKPRLWDKYNLLARLAADPRTAKFVPPLVSPGQVEPVLACGRKVLVRGYLAYAGQHPLAHQIDPVLVDAAPTFRLWHGADPGTAFARELADYRQTLACYSQIFGFDEKKNKVFLVLTGRGPAV
jgi:hypothetical protein